MLLTTIAAVLALFPANPATLTIPTAQAAYIASDYSTSTLRAYAYQTALDSGLDADLFVRVLNCESHFVWNARGDHGTSLGVAQLHDVEADWGIATSTAFDPYASIRIAAAAWQRGEQGRWSCWHLRTGM